MKREIKFRGKKVQMRGSMDTLEAGEFVFGSYVWDGYEHFIITDENIEWCVDPETVGQYTGLKDRTGAEIYEGDIVQTETISYSESGHFNGMVKVKGAVFYDNGKFQAQYTDHTIRGLLFGLNYHEVIGNRWDNPDLLEG